MSWETYSMQEPEARSIFQAMMAVAEIDEDTKDLWNEIVEAASRYSTTRLKWETATLDEKLSMDESRSLQHDVFMIKLNQFARYAELNQLDHSWREQLGDPKRDPENRKRMGDLACWICLFLELKAR